MAVYFVLLLVHSFAAGDLSGNDHIVVSFLSAVCTPEDKKWKQKAVIGMYPD
jgi:hypothetical protein